MRHCYPSATKLTQLFPLLARALIDNLPIPLEHLHPMTAILLVEDAEPLRTVIGTVLDSRGYECIPVGNGREAIHELRRRSFDAMIIDLILPEFPGISVISWAAQNRPTMAILATTGRQERYGNEALLAGAHNVLYKPFMPRELLSVLQMTLKGDRAEPEPQLLRFSA